MDKLRLITCIVEKGKGEATAKAALEAGARGATYFEGKGTGIRQSLLSTIIPEKEVVFVVVKNEGTDTVYNSMIKRGGLEKPGKGFIYVSELEKAFGFLEDYPEAAIQLRPVPSMENITLSLENEDLDEPEDELKF